jgi:DNA polymerase-1
MPESRPKLYLVDAMSNIHRAFHAIQRLSTSEGKPTNAIYGFVTMLRKMLREHRPDYLAVAWDGPERTVRHEVYTEYKANRPAMADDLASQIPDIRRILAAYRIPILELPGYEADDVIGTLAKRAAAAGFDTVIVTADKDMLQLVAPGVRVYHTGRERFLDEAGVKELFGVAPHQVADVLALMGDSVDNIPGVPGVGQVTAKKWIAAYGDLPTLLERAGEIKGKVGESLREHRENALLSRRLVAIPTDLPIPFEPDSLRCAPADFPHLKELFVELEFHSLAAEIQGEAAAPPAVSWSRLAPGVASSIDPSAPLGLALLTRGEKTLLAASDGSIIEIMEEPATAFLERWKALDRPGRPVAIADAKPLDTTLARAGAAVAGELFDVGLAQYVLAPGVASSDFEIMAFQRLGQRATTDKEAGVLSGTTLPEGYVIDAAERWLAERARGSLRLAGILRAELGARPELERIYREIERPLSAAAPGSGVPRGRQAQGNLRRRAAGARGRRGTRPLLLPADGRGHRAALLLRSEPAEHPGSDRRGTRDPTGLRGTLRKQARRRGLFADRAPGPRASVRGRSAHPGLRGRAGHPPGDCGANLRRLSRSRQP